MAAPQEKTILKTFLKNFHAWIKDFVRNTCMHFIKNLARSTGYRSQFLIKNEINSVVVNSPIFQTLERCRRCKFKYILCWTWHCMNKIHEQKPFTGFLHVSVECLSCQIFYSRCLAVSHIAQSKIILKIHQAWREHVTYWLGCSPGTRGAEASIPTAAHYNNL